MPAGFPLFRPSSITSGLVGYWKLDEASGNRADSSGNGNTLTDNNTVTSVAQDYWKTGENSAFFTRANSETLSITDASQTGLEPSGSWSIAFWAKVTSASVTNGVIEKDSNAYRIILTDVGQISLYSGGSNMNSDTGVIVAGKWNHIVCVYNDTASEGYIYLNGNLISTSTAPNTPSYGSSAVVIGNYALGSGYFGGSMKDLALWNTVLTPIQIKSLALGVDLSNYAYRPSNVSTQPTAWWKLNETSGTRNDSIGSNHLTDNNTVTALGGYIEGIGADFEDANSERLTIAHASQTGLSITGSYSVSLWMKCESSTGDDYMVGKWVSNTGWSIAVSSLTGIVVIHNSTTYTFSKTLVAGTWYHIVVNYNSSAATIDCYIDGALVSQSTSVATISTNSNPFEIGAFANGSNFYDGVLSDVAFWSGYNLTTAEIKSLACAIPLQQTGLVSYWKLDETSGNRADSIGSNTLTDNNTVLYGTGKVSNAADFESTNSEYLSIADGSQSGLDLTTDFTVLCWVNAESTAANATLMSKWNSATGWALRMTAGNVFRLEIDGTGLETTDTLADATWGHIVGRWTGATREIYINSKQSTTGAATSAPTDVAHAFNLGAYNSASEYYDGLMDEALVAKRWFRDEEIKTIYCKGLAGKELTNSEIQLGGNQVIWFL